MTIHLSERRLFLAWAFFTLAVPAYTLAIATSCIAIGEERAMKRCNEWGYGR